MRWDPSNEDLLEGTVAPPTGAADRWATAAMVEGFLNRTPALTLGEQAELFGAFVLGEAAAPARSSPPPSRPAPSRPAPAAAARPTGSPSRPAAAQRPAGNASPRPAGGPSPTRPAGSPTSARPAGSPTSTRPAGNAAAASRPAAPERRGTDWGQIFRGVQTGLGAFGQGAQMISQFATMFGGNDRTAQDFARIAGQIGQGTGQAASMLQSITGGQVPPLPGPAPAAPEPPAAAPPAPAWSPEPAAAPPPAGDSPMPAPTPTAPPIAAPPPAAAYAPPMPSAPAQPAGQFNATALLGLLLSNPQLQQALRAAPVLGQASPRAVQLPMPPGAPSPSVSIPLGAVLNAIGALTSRSIAELHESTSEFDEEVPAYLLGESDEFVVDPGEADARAAVVLQYFRAAGEAARFGGVGESSLDESEAWLRDAGFEDWGS